MATTLQRYSADAQPRPAPVRTGVLSRWHRLRRDLSLISVIAAAICGVVFAWPEMFIAGGLTLAVTVDARIALRTHRSGYLPSLLADITITGVTFAIVAVPPVGIAAATTYFILLVALLGRSWRAWPVGAYAVVVGAGASWARPMLGMPEASTIRLVTAGTVAAGVFSIAITIVATRFGSLLRKRFDEEETRVRRSQAASSAARALVARDDGHALENAIEAIRAGVRAETLFIEHNEIDPADGLVGVVVGSSTSRASINHVYEPGFRTSWSALGRGKAHLEGGAPFFYRIEESAGTGSDRSGAGGANSEVNIPIISDGRWLGVVGAADSQPGRRWHTDDLILLRTLADLTAAFWQRIEDLRVRDSLIGSLDGRLRYEEALAKSSQALLGGKGMGVEGALDAVGVAARVDEVYVTMTTQLADESLGAETIESWVQPGILPTKPVGVSMPYDTMPTVRDAIHTGALARTGDGIVEELVAPIEVGAGGFGTVGFVRRQSTQPWSKREAAFLRTIADILGAYYERAETRERLESLIQSKNQLIASVSHELRTPLTAVVGLAEELGAADQQIAPAERQQLIAVIAHESREMADLVEDLVVAAQSEDGEVNVFPERTDLSLLAANVASRLSPPDEVTLTVDDQSSAAFADPVRVRQVIRNLLTNAVRYGGRQVRVTFGGDDRWAYVDVHDDGSGIPDHDLEAIFEPFRRSSHTAPAPGSVGLGLTLSKRLAELMGGSLSYIDSDGCTFRLTVPRTPDAAT